MKKLVYLLACLSLPMACLFILLSMLAQANAAPPTAAPLPIRLDYGRMGTASLASPDARDKDAPLATLTLGTWHWRMRALSDGEFATTWHLIVAEPVVQVTNSNSDRDPAIVQAADDKLWAFFTSYRDGGFAYLWSQTSTDGGTTWSAAVPFTQIYDDDYFPSAVSAEDGKLWVVWYRTESGGNIWYKTSTDNGATWSAATRLTTDPANDREPSIARTTDGTLWVVWQSNRSGNADIWYKTSSDGGATWSSEVQLTTDSNEDQQPTITQGADGKLWVVWTREGQLWYRTSADGGVNWSLEAKIDDTCCHSNPSLLAAGDGTLWLASERDSDIWYRISDDHGDNWSEPERFTCYVGYDDAPALTGLADGEVAIAWHSDRGQQWWSNVWFGVFGMLEDVNPPPFVGWIGAQPDKPDSTQEVVVSVVARDESPGLNVELVWSLDGEPQANLPMYDDGTHGDTTAGDNRWSVQIGPFPAGTLVQYQAQATDSGGNTILHPPGPYSFRVVEPFVKTTDILFVPDYGGNSTDWFRPYYTNAMDSLGYSYDVWDTGLRGEIDSATLNQYADGTVVWAVPDWGYATDGSSSSQANLQSYLDNGGKLFISGQDIGYYTEGSTFFSDYLHAIFVQDDTDLYGLNGVSGDLISDGLYLAIAGGDGANNQDYPSEIDPIVPAVTIFTYDPSAIAALGEPHLTEEMRAYPDLGLEGPYLERERRPKKPRESARLQSIVSSGTGAIRVDTGTYRVVYFAFGFEGINSASARAAVMERVLAWLRGVLPRPTQISPADGSAVPIGDVTFTWNSVVGASGYQIQIDTTTAFTSTDLISDTVASTSYTATLTLGTWYWRVRALPDGLWTAVWEVRVTEPLIRVTTDLADDWSPAIARTSDGKLWVVWDSWRSDNNIWYRTSDDNGVIWSADMQLTTDPSWDYDPAIMQAGDGTIWVVWYSWRSGNADIWYKTSSDGGVTWSAATQLTTDPSSDYGPAITQASDGTIWVVWYSYRTGNADIWYKTSSDGGGTWSSAVQLTMTPEYDYRPAIAQTSDGTIWVLWDSRRTDHPAIWYKTSTDGGASWSADAEFSTDTNWDYAPTIAQTSNGTIWVARMSESWDSWTFDIWYRTSNDGGISWSADQQFTRFTGDDLYPGLAALPSDQVALVWSSDRAVNFDVWFGIISLHGDVNSPPHLDFTQNYPWPNPDSNDIVTILALVSDETGVLNVTLKWSEDSTPQPDLMMYDDGVHNDYGVNDGWYGVQIGPFPAGTIVEYQVEVTDVDGNTILAPPYPMSFETLEPFVKTADILFVPDYGGYDTSWFRSYYEDALGMQGYQYNVWDTGLRGAPDSATLNLYTSGVVIWAVPYWGYFDDWDVQPTIEAYLDAGGKLFITGQNVAQNLNGTNLLSDYLHASYVQGNTNLYVLNGTTGDPIGDGLALAISGGDGANNQWSPDEIDPISPAVTVFTYDTSGLAALAEPVRPEVRQPEWKGSERGVVPIPAPWRGSQGLPGKPVEVETAADLQDIISSGTGGLRVDTGTYKVVFFSFGFEAINSAVDRQLVMERVLDWTWSLPGDLDFNCVVNVADIMRVANRWRMVDTDPDWNPRYDLNGDGIITVVDIMLVVKHWGETCESTLLYVLTEDGIVEVSLTGGKQTIIGAHGGTCSIEIFEDKLYASEEIYGGDISVYDLQGNYLKTIPTPPQEVNTSAS